MILEIASLQIYIFLVFYAKTAVLSKLASRVSAEWNPRTLA